MLETALVWFRRDLRDYDHAALYHALKSARRVWCAFVFDTDILDALPDRADRRVEFIRESLVELHHALAAKGGGLIVRYGPAAREIPALVRELGVQAVFANRDYEPAAKARDVAVAADLAGDGRELRLFKDQAIFDGAEVLTKGGTPYTVFTPYKNAWLARLTDFYVRPYPVDAYTRHLAPPPGGGGVPTLAEIGFQPTDLAAIGMVPGMAGAATRWQDFQERMARYGEQRDFPAVKGVSYLSVYLRFGCLSIRQLAAAAWREGNAGANTWLSELIWRDFYFMVLDHFPQLPAGSFKPEFDRVQWDDAPALLDAWREGRTGYPLVDAAMRQLRNTGWMHNRLRMVVASFLTKDLGIDWRAGEAYFADLLLDFDLSANNGGWQWAASTGCDAQPWFRIFNPITQSEKFDPQGRFIRRYVPELAKVPDKFIHAPWRMAPLEQQAAGVVIGRDYPAPVVDHDQARRRTLGRFEVVKGKGGDGRKDAALD